MPVAPQRRRHAPLLALAALLVLLAGVSAGAQELSPAAARAAPAQGTAQESAEDFDRRVSAVLGPIHAVAADLFAQANAAPIALARPADAGETLVLHECLVLPDPGPSHLLQPIRTDAATALMVAGRWSPPRAGDELTLPDGTVIAWREATADAEGYVAAAEMYGGVVSWQFSLPSPRLMLLDGDGHLAASVNGVPRVGDLSAHGSAIVPVALRKGANEILFRPYNRVRAKLSPAPSEALLNPRGSKLPDLVVGSALSAPAAVIVLNATHDWMAGLYIEAQVADGRATRTPLAAVPPLAMSRVAFSLEAEAPAEAGTLPLALTLRRDGLKDALDRQVLSLDVRSPDGPRRVTFTSAIDGSIQKYGLLAPRSIRGDASPPALLLTLHGGGQRAMDQVSYHAAKSWAVVAAPTDRGSSWEDWGRRGALEVLDLVAREWNTDRRRTILVGYSMGGHGAWHLGTTFPGRFAAIAPVAGWGSFWTYESSQARAAGALPGERWSGSGPIDEILARASNPSDVPALMTNLEGVGVYVMHGDADDSVPILEARELRARLEGWHRDLRWHEEPGGGHCWDDTPDDRGQDCLEWPAMMDFLARRATTPAPRHVDFTTMSPGVSAAFPLGVLVAQERAFLPSRVRLDRSGDGRTVTGTTSNVTRLALDLEPSQGPFRIDLDGASIMLEGVPESGRVHLEREGLSSSAPAAEAAWHVVSGFPPSDKGPRRHGPFKEAFVDRPVLVFGTRGTREDRTWSLERARYDSERFSYALGGVLQLVADVDYDRERFEGRNVVLYGNADTNAAWDELLVDSPVQVRRGLVRVGRVSFRGDDLGCLLVRPMPDDDDHLVAAIAGTGSAGQRLTDHLPIFSAGIGWPDIAVVDSSILTAGSKGVRAAGFFAVDWSLDGADVAISAPAAHSRSPGARRARPRQ